MYVNIVLYDDFEAMDAFIPGTIFGNIPDQFHVRYLSLTGDVVNSTDGAKIWTDYLIPEEIEGVLLLPGGKGARRLFQNDPRFLSVLKQCMEHAETCMMVGNSSMLMAQTGLLYSRLVADCRMSENWKRMFTAQVRWVPEVNWISDGKYYSCASGADSAAMVLAYIADAIDLAAAEKTAEKLGINWDSDDI